MTEGYSASTPRRQYRTTSAAKLSTILHVLVMLLPSHSIFDMLAVISDADESSAGNSPQLVTEKRNDPRATPSNVVEVARTNRSENGEKVKQMKRMEVPALRRKRRLERTMARKRCWA